MISLDLIHIILVFQRLQNLIIWCRTALDGTIYYDILHTMEGLFHNFFTHFNTEATDTHSHRHAQQKETHTHTQYLSFCQSRVVISFVWNRIACVDCLVWYDMLDSLIRILFGRYQQLWASIICREGNFFQASIHMISIIFRRI